PVAVGLQRRDARVHRDVLPGALRAVAESGLSRRGGPGRGRVRGRGAGRGRGRVADVLRARDQRARGGASLHTRRGLPGRGRPACAARRGPLLAGQPAAAREPEDGALRGDPRRGPARAGAARGACDDARSGYHPAREHHRSMTAPAMHVLLTMLLLGAPPPEGKVPPPPFLPLVYKHADAILEAGFTLETGRAQAQENWLRVLYTLSELSSKPKYREAADGALKKYLESGGGLDA